MLLVADPDDDPSCADKSLTGCKLSKLGFIKIGSQTLFSKIGFSFLLHPGI